MFNRMALGLAGILARRGIIEDEDTAVYSYGLELMLSTAASILIVIVLSFLFWRPLSWVFFLLPFIPLRVTAGGYHAKTHLGCCITFGAAYAILLAAGIYGAAYLTPPVLIGVSVLSFAITLLLSPVPSSNKPLTAEEKRRNRNRGLVISGVCVVVTAFSLLAGAPLLALFTYFTLGQFGAAFSLIAAKLVHN